jgi:hypothetical protein
MARSISGMSYLQRRGVWLPVIVDVYITTSADGYIARSDSDVNPITQNWQWCHL